MAELSLPDLGLPSLTVGRRKKKSNSPETEYDPAASKSLLGKLGGGVMSGLEIGANFLDLATGGSSVRDVLAGQNPVDQFLTPFSSENRTTGRDLLRSAGLASRKDTIGNFWGGVGAEILLDPGSWATLGGSALTRGGQVAKAAGALDDVAKLAGMGKRQAGMATTLGELATKSAPEVQDALQTAAKGLGVDFAAEADKPLRGLVGVGLPFQDPSFVLGTGKVAQKIGGALDVAGAAVKGSLAGRTLRSYFDPSVMGKVDPLEQQIAEMVYKARPVAQRKARETFVNLLSEYRDTHKAFDDAFGASLGANLPPSEARDATLKAFDDIVHFTGESDVGKAFSNVSPNLRQTPEMDQKISALSESMKKANLLIHSAIEDKGGWTGWIPNHMARFMKGVGSEKSVQGSQLLPTLHAGMKARTPAIKSIPKAIVNKISSDPTVRGEASEVLQKYGRWLDPNFGLTKEEIASKAHRATIDVTIDKYDDISRMQSWRAIMKTPAGEEIGRAMGSTNSDRIKVFNAGIGKKYRGQKYGSEFYEHLARKAIGIGKEFVSDVEVTEDAVRLYESLKRKGFAVVQNPDAKWETVDGIKKLISPRVRGTPTKSVFTVTGPAPPLPKAASQIDEHAKAVADWAAGLPKGAGDTFTGSSIDDFSKYQMGAHLVDRSLDAIQYTIKENLVDSGGVMLDSAFTQAGMNPAYAMEYLSKLTGKSVQELAQKQIPGDVLAAIKGTLEISKTPAWQNRIAEAIDSFNGMFKRAVTLPFPGFHMRNHVSGQYANLASGYINTPSDIADYAGAYKQALKLFGSKDQKLIDELYIAGVLHPERLAQDVDLPASLSKGTSNMLWSQPVSSPLDFPGALGDARAVSKAQTSVVPEALRTAYGTVQNVGGRTAQATEFLNRVPMFLYLRKKGWDLQAAVNKVDDLQVNYDQLSPFEKSAMRRLVPFYTWQRRMAPVILSTLSERPGGHMAQTLRAINRARKPDEVTPDYVAETASIPLGETPTGDKSYLTGFGLPFEPPFQYLGGGLRGAGLEALSQMTPLVKGPLEFATGETFWQRGPEGGRSLADLDPTIGRTISNIGNLTGLRESKAPVRLPEIVEQAIANTPLTRFATTARQLTDTRTDPLTKALNLGTGVRVATISPAAQDAVIRERAQEAERRLGGKTFIKSYIPADVLAAMSPAEKEDAMRLQALLNTLSARTKERKKATAP